MSNIVDVVGGDKQLVSMSKSVKAAGLDKEWTKKGPFTLFAPTDMAFGKLKEGELQDLLKPENKLKLTGILNHHVVEGKMLFKELKDGQKLKTLDGKQLEVKVQNGEISINGAKLHGRDREATNGVVYTVDKLISGK